MNSSGKAQIYRDASASVEVRTADLLGRMTLDEKLAQLHAFWLILSPNGEHKVRSDSFTGGADQATLKKMLSHGLGQITRPLGSRPIDPVDGVRALNSLQKFMLDETRLGIPVMSHEECLTGVMTRGATLFPSALAYGATWNPELIEAVGAAIGEEIGQAIGDSAAGLAVWSTIHGLAILILENVIDLGQTQAGMDVVPSRAEIILRSLTEALSS